jgi:soluble lytic murein transglycosylase-like protein
MIARVAPRICAWTAVVLLALGASPAGSEAAPVAPAGAAAPADRIAAAVREAATVSGLPPHWIEAVMGAESGRDPQAVSRAGAMGLMQLMPGTWAMLRSRLRLGPDPFDVRDNLVAGAAYLREMHDRFGAPGFLAAYNAGPARYAEHLSRGRPLPAETRAYVRRLAPRLAGARGPEAAPLHWTLAPLFAQRSGGASAPDGLFAGTRGTGP